METGTRACWCEGRRALFHQWVNEAYVVAQSPMVGGTPAGQLWAVLALVEFENGDVKTVRPEKIKFADGGNGGFSAVFFGDKGQGRGDDG